MAGELSTEERRAAVLLDTVQFYGADPARRAVELGVCRYVTQDGRRCAIGRLLPDDVAKRWAERYQGPACTNVLVDGFEHIEPLGEDFIGALQALHDNCTNWEEAGPGLSPNGQFTVCFIDRHHCGGLLRRSLSRGARHG